MVKVSVCPICVVFILLCGCLSTPMETLLSGEHVDTFVSTWNCADTLYCSFEDKNIDWQRCYSKHFYFCSQIENDTELLQVLLNLLAELQDQQIQITVESQTFQAYEKEYTVNILPSVIFQYLEPYGGLSWVGSFFGYTTASNGLSYVQIRRLQPDFPLEEFCETINSVFSESEYIIIDLRPNSGENGPGKEVEVAGCFSDTEWIGWYQVEKQGDELSDPEPFILQPDGTVFFDRQVILLTGQYCCKSTELFISAMKALPEVTTVGEHTRGYVGEVVEIILPNQWILGFPYMSYYSSEMNPISSYGVLPDILVTTSQEELNQGIDPVLEKAFEMAGVF